MLISSTGKSGDVEVDFDPIDCATQRAMVSTEFTPLNGNSPPCCTRLHGFFECASSFVRKGTIATAGGCVIAGSIGVVTGVVANLSNAPQLAETCFNVAILLLGSGLTTGAIGFVTYGAVNLGEYCSRPYAENLAS